MSVYKLVCPACGASVRIRTSEGQTPTFRSVYGQCTNMACSLSLSGSFSWDYQLNTSGMDHPRVVLPIAPSVVRMKALKDNRHSNQPDLLDSIMEDAQA